MSRPREIIPPASAEDQLLDKLVDLLAEQAVDEDLGRLAGQRAGAHHVQPESEGPR